MGSESTSEEILTITDLLDLALCFTFMLHADGAALPRGMGCHCVLRFFEIAQRAGKE